MNYCTYCGKKSSELSSHARCSDCRKHKQYPRFFTYTGVLIPSDIREQIAKRPKAS